MQELKLRYGCNPNQNIASVSMKEGELPFEILNGNPGYINLMDAFNAWQLVKELKEATGLASATSFKHVSPAGAAVAVPLSDALKKAYFVENYELSDIATAYIRARGADRVASYGDFAALSDECDESTAKILANEVSDGIIAPSYSDKALEILKTKKKGNYLVMKMNPQYSAPETEKREIFGITFEQMRNNIKIDDKIFENIVTANKIIPENAKRDLMLAMIILKYTQSNSVCYVKDGQATGIGAGQQARIHCTRLAGDKSDKWFLKQHEKVSNLPFKPEIRRVDKNNVIDEYISNEYENILNGWEQFFLYKPQILTADEKNDWLKQQKDLCLASDAYFPFGDNIERAKKSGVQYIAETGGSIRDDNVIEVCNKYNIAMAFTGIRLFHH